MIARHVRRITCFAIALAPILAAQQPTPKPTTAAEAPNRDTSYIDANGTAHVTRVVPVPQTISPEAQKSLGRREPDQGPPQPLEQRRKMTDAYTASARIEWTKICPNTIVEQKMAGVPVRIVTPEGMPGSNDDKVLLNLHGGGFNSDSGSYTESIPIAGYTKIKVVAVLYRLSPEVKFPAAVDDSIAVYKELLKTYQPKHIVIYGTSAGAILTAEVAAKIKQLGLPMPAALGIFSGMGDFARNGDSIAMYALRGLAGHLDPPEPGAHDPYYVASTDPKDPVLSPIYGDLHGLPPTLFVTSGRDLLLSGTVNLHRAYLLAGVDARLVVYDALTHAFWYDPKLPEAIEANHVMADFFVQQLAR
ncbi:alpha/beta hydrolase [Occallatibacter savannae]|uniref:alpha/beta hydrolase n=1 Tax=Occallatibacter savannae TaxID=1002691 RepID=UPI000D69B94E|nr:alpha/beta hydrolase [Occallatibacter savannae]